MKLLFALGTIGLVKAFTPISQHLLAHRLSRIAGSEFKASETAEFALAEFPELRFSQPLDHFSPTGDTWNQRYWISTRHYTPGSNGPVIVLDGGETSGANRLPFLDTGIVDILTEATGGVGVILEHRYYGASVPVLNFTTDSLRWLTNEQANEDAARFMKNFAITLNGTTIDLSAPKTPWIYYGGSYAGARAAHMRVLYPDLVWGGISSSGVTKAQITNWGYWDLIRRSAPANCSTQLVKAIKEVDDLLSKDAETKKKVKKVFDVEGITLDADLTSLFFVFGGWQSLNWDPAISSASFPRNCAAMGAPSDEVVPLVQGLNVSTALYNLALIVNRTTNSCTGTADECFGTIDDSIYQGTDLSDTWKLWPYQVCTQWGYFDEPPPPGAKIPGESYPPGKRPPSLVSKFVDLEYSSKFCAQAYPAGEKNRIPKSPHIQDVNKHGGFNIKFNRLAIIDGEIDPWIFNTPHSWISPTKVRPDTINRPFKVIPKAVHHWDENGLADRNAEPPDIQKIHKEMIGFVKAWLAEFKSGK